MDKEPRQDIEYAERANTQVEHHVGVLRFASILAFVVTPVGLAGVLGMAVVHSRLARQDVEAALERPGAEAAARQGPTTASDPVLALHDAQDRVEALEVELAIRTEEVAVLEAQGEHAETARVAALTMEVAALKRSVDRARRDRESLRSTLHAALADLDRAVTGKAIAQRHVEAYSSANTENLWAAFTQRTKIDVCRQVTEGGRARCREKVDAWFDDDRHARFASCVDAGQSVPTLWKRSGSHPLPSTADLVSVHDFGQAHNWYVVFCDPSLPEAQVAGEDDEPQPPVFTASRK